MSSLTLKILKFRLLVCANLGRCGSACWWVAAFAVCHSHGEQLTDCALLQTLEEPLFNVLRTQKQLGYSTGVTPTDTVGVLGLLISVVSDKAPHYVEAPVESFLADFMQTLSSMDDKDFSEHVESLVALSLENHKNISEQAEEHWQAVSRRSYDFYDRYMVCFSHH
jgi:secreted Zn-dependent insulinase-like peptidase